jgi:hypothetical protein
MATPVDVNEPSPRRSESRGITTAAMLLLAAGVGLLGLESCTQAPDAKTNAVKDSKDPAAKDVKVPDAKPDAKPEVKPEEKPVAPEPMPPPAT